MAASQPMRRNPDVGDALTLPIAVLPQCLVPATLHPLSTDPDVSRAIPIVVPWPPDQQDGGHRRRRHILGARWRDWRVGGKRGRASTETKNAEASENDSSADWSLLKPLRTVLRKSRRRTKAAIVKSRRCTIPATPIIVSVYDERRDFLTTSLIQRYGSISRAAASRIRTGNARASRIACVSARPPSRCITAVSAAARSRS